jgi:TatD DNase family protein
VAPRITSVHTFGATETVLNCLTARPIQDAVLHWWLGSGEQTRRAVELGCHFSVNAAMLKLLSLLPLDRVLTETDHPFGDRSGGRGRRPGNMESVEQAIARLHGIDSEEVRQVTWQNLARLVRVAKCGSLLPRAVRVTLAALP